MFQYNNLFVVMYLDIDYLFSDMVKKQTSLFVIRMMMGRGMGDMEELKKQAEREEEWVAREWERMLVDGERLPEAGERGSGGEKEVEKSVEAGGGANVEMVEMMKKQQERIQLLEQQVREQSERAEKAESEVAIMSKVMELPKEKVLDSWEDVEKSLGPALQEQWSEVKAKLRSEATRSVAERVLMRISVSMRMEMRDMRERDRTDLVDKLVLQEGEWIMKETNWEERNDIRKAVLFQVEKQCLRRTLKDASKAQYGAVDIRPRKIEMAKVAEGIREMAEKRVRSQRKDFVNDTLEERFGGMMSNDAGLWKAQEEAVKTFVGGRRMTRAELQKLTYRGVGLLWLALRRGEKREKKPWELAVVGAVMWGDVKLMLAMGDAIVQFTGELEEVNWPIVRRMMRERCSGKRMGEIARMEGMGDGVLVKLAREAIYAQE